MAWVNNGYLAVCAVLHGWRRRFHENLVAPNPSFSLTTATYLSWVGTIFGIFFVLFCSTTRHDNSLWTWTRLATHADEARPRLPRCTCIMGVSGMFALLFIGLLVFRLKRL
jgi:hypothetical protein